MKDLLSIKLDLVRFELLTVKQIRGNRKNTEIKNQAIENRVLELEFELQNLRTNKEILNESKP